MSKDTARQEVEQVCFASYSVEKFDLATAYLVGKALGVELVEVEN